MIVSIDRKQTRRYLIQKTEECEDVKDLAGIAAIDTIHFSFCMKALCPFIKRYRDALEQSFPKTGVVIGTHRQNAPPEEFRQRVKRLFGQPRKTIIDIILKKDQED